MKNVSQEQSNITGRGCCLEDARRNGGGGVVPWKLGFISKLSKKVQGSETNHVCTPLGAVPVQFHEAAVLFDPVSMLCSDYSDRSSKDTEKSGSKYPDSGSSLIRVGVDSEWLVVEEVEPNEPIS